MKKPSIPSSDPTKTNIQAIKEILEIITGRRSSVIAKIPANFDSDIIRLKVNELIDLLQDSGAMAESSTVNADFVGTVATGAQVSNTPAGNIAATTVQAALNELDAEKAKLAGDVAQAFSASALTLAALTGALRADAGVVSVGMVRTADVTPVLVGSGQATSAAHSFGVVPSIAILEYINITAEQSYEVGDVMQISAQWNGSIPTDVMIYKSTTSVGVVAATGYSLMGRNKATGAAFTPTAASWAYRFVISK